MNPDAGADLLAQLRDIHAAPEAPFWPPAPGWWILTLIAILALAWFARHGFRAWRRLRDRKALEQRFVLLREEFDPMVHPQAYLAAANRLLKGIALKAFPGDACAGLQGEAWVEFLNPEQDDDPTKAFSALATGPYHPAPSFDVEQLESAARQWIRRHG